MRSRREPKVHKYRRRRGRQITGPGRALLSTCFTLVIAGAVGVLGYSIAKPILEFAGAQDPTAPAAESMTAEMAPTEQATQTPMTELATQPATEPGVTPMAQTTQGIQLPQSALVDRQALETALDAARQAVPGGEVLVVPLKIQGGAILYQTAVPLATQCGAVQGTMTLDEIASTIAADGWTPVAQISLLDDNLLPNADAQAGYTIATSGSRWLDNTLENGGKPWVSPFSGVTLDYLTALVEEIAAGGFTQIWCSDVRFPSFRSTDLEYIGATVQDPGRGQALVQLVNTLAQTAGDVPVLVEEDAAAVLDHTSEVLDPQMLAVAGVVLDLASGTQAQTAITRMLERAPEMPVWLSLSDDALSQEIADLAEDTAQVYGWVYTESE